MQGWVWFSSLTPAKLQFPCRSSGILRVAKNQLSSGKWAILVWIWLCKYTSTRHRPAYADYCEVYFILILSLEDQHSEKVIMLCLFHNTSILFPFIYLLFSQPDWEKLGDPNLPLLRRRRYCWDLMSPLLHHVNVMARRAWRARRIELFK